MGMIIMNGKEYVGSGGGGSLTMLNNTAITSLNTPVSLADDITNYDLILVHAYYTGGDGYPLVAAQTFVPSQLITHNRQTWLVGGNADRLIMVEFPTNTTIQMKRSNGSNGIQGIYGIKFYGNSNTDRHDYSTTEHVVGTWIDGKPIYERSFTKTLANSPDADSSSFLVASNVTGIETLIKIEGTIKAASAYAFAPVCGLPVQVGWNYAFHINPTNQLVVWTSNAYANYSNIAGGTAICTLQYTKITDT